MAEAEKRFCEGRSVADYFDLITGTSTGGIIALGLGARIPISKLLDLYVRRGSEIFPEPKRNVTGYVKSALAKLWSIFHHRYDPVILERLLKETLGDRLLGDSASRLCIPSFDGKHSEVFVYKTPHHPDYKLDRFQKMTTVALATSAAPTYFRPHEHEGYQLVDGGVWANNPIMLAIIEALVCWDITPDRIDVLSIGCGEEPYFLSPAQRGWSGLFFWRTVIFAAMRLQSLAATNQARLLLGPPSVVRIGPKSQKPPIELDDYRRSVDILPGEALAALEENAEKVRRVFFTHQADGYIPTPVPN